VTITRLLDIVWRWTWLIVLGTLLAGGIGWLASRRATPMYEATARLLVTQVVIPGVSTYQDSTTIDRQARSYSELLSSWPVLQEAIRQLGLPLAPETLAKRVTTSMVKDTQFLEVTVQDETPGGAAAIANRIADVFIARNRDLQAGVGQDAQQQIVQELADTRAKVDDASSRLAALRANPGASADANGQVALVQGELTQYQQLYYQLLDIQQRMALEQSRGASSIAVVDPARAPAAPLGPGPRQNALIAALAGLLLCVGVVTLIEFLDDRVRDPNELREGLSLTPLTILGRHRGRTDMVLNPADLTGKNTFAEALRLLRTNLDFLAQGQSQVLVLSSALEGEGKSTVATNLAITEVQAGKRVVLIDADLRKPSVHRAFGVPNTQGLSTYLSQPQGVVGPVFQAGPLGLRLLTSGPIPPNPSELLGSARMAVLLDNLRGQADIVIIDSAPILPVADTLALQRHVDGVILVLDVRRTGMKTLGRAVERLRQVSANMVGVVLNRDRRNKADYYGYDHASSRPSRRFGRAIAAPTAGSPSTD